MGIVVELNKEYRYLRFPEVKGIATARCEHLHSATRILLEYLKDGELVEVWLDECELELVE